MSTPFDYPMILREGHPAIGEPCVLCHEPLEAGDALRFVIIGPPDKKNLAKLKRGDTHTVPVKLAHVSGQCKAVMILRCTCCGHEEEFSSLEDAFNQGWDEPDRLSTWPVSCPLCPGVASLGLIDHSAAHERWAREGRPPDFVTSVAEGECARAMSTDGRLYPTIERRTAE